MRRRATVTESRAALYTHYKPSEELDYPDLVTETMSAVLENIQDPTPSPNLALALFDFISPFIASRKWHLIHPLIHACITAACVYVRFQPLLAQTASTLIVLYDSFEDVERISLLGLLPMITDRASLSEFVCRRLLQLDALPYMEGVTLLEIFSRLVDHDELVGAIREDNDLRDLFQYFTARYEGEWDDEYVPPHVLWLLGIERRVSPNEE